LVALGLTGFVLISVSRDYRNTGDRTGSLVDAVTSSVSNAEATGREFFLGLDTAMLPAFAVELSSVPDVIPYQLGSTYVEAALRTGVPVTGVLTGDALSQLSEEALIGQLSRVNLFCRVNPQQKNRILLALKKLGHVVGFMGDGINDAPALHAADASRQLGSIDDAVTQIAKNFACAAESRASFSLPSGT